MEDSRKFSIFSFAIALGVTWGLGMTALGLMSWLWDWGTPLLQIIGSVYIGAEANLLGVVKIGAWGLVDGFFAGFVFAWIYNTCISFGD